MSSKVCNSSLRILKDSIINVELQGLKAFDSFGKLPPHGILEGNFQKMGSYHSCLDVDIRHNETSFQGKYCWVMNIPKSETLSFSDFSSGNQDKFPSSPLLFPDGVLVSRIPWRFSVCLPSSCSDRDIEGILTSWFNQEGFSAELKVRSCHTRSKNTEFSAADIIMISILLFFLFLSLSATFLDYLKLYNKAKGFSLVTNVTKLLNTQTHGKGKLECLDGIRFLSMSWVLLSHVSSLCLTNLPLQDVFNLKQVLKKIVTFLNGYSCVDTFFLLSGLLLGYLFFRELDKRKGKFNLLLFYLHRYIRITGVYAIVIGFHATLARFFFTGPTSNYNQPFVEDCHLVWWRNLLYINNLDMEPYCLGHTWYLAADMQMYWISPLMVVPMWWMANKFSRRLAYIYALLWIGVATLIPLVLTIIHDWPASSATEPLNFDFSSKNYIVPWCRFQPYGVGVALGILLHTTRETPVIIKKRYVISAWISATAVALSIIYGLDPTAEHSKLENALYGGFNRLGWSLAVGWMIFACSRGYGGWINRFLSWEAFRSLSKLTFNIYLIHYTIIVIIMGKFTFSLNFSYTMLAILILYVMVISILVSALLFIFIELPLVNCEKLILPRNEAKTKKYS